jgi:hypothetical protein
MYTPDTLPEWKAKLLSQLDLGIWETREGILNVRVWRPLEVIGPTGKPSSRTLAAGDHELELLKSPFFHLYGCSTRRQDGCTEMDTDNTTCAVVLIIVDIL